DFRDFHRGSVEKRGGSCPKIIRAEQRRRARYPVCIGHTQFHVHFGRNRRRYLLSRQNRLDFREFHRGSVEKRGGSCPKIISAALCERARFPVCIGHTQFPVLFGRNRRRYLLSRQNRLDFRDFHRGSVEKRGGSCPKIISAALCERARAAFGSHVGTPFLSPGHL